MLIKLSFEMSYIIPLVLCFPTGVQVDGTGAEVENSCSDLGMFAPFSKNSCQIIPFFYPADIREVNNYI